MSDQSQVTGEKVSYSAGDIIFKEGDPGGDLFLIKGGEIEVYRNSDRSPVRLAVLKPGEILGVMTCLTRDPRLASARALSDVDALIVKQAGFNNLIATTPKWVKTVIKDFILRIKNLNDMYGKVVGSLQEHQRRTSNMALAANIAVYLRNASNDATDENVACGPLVEAMAMVFDCETDHVVGIVSALGVAGIIDLRGGASGTMTRSKATTCIPYANYTRSYLQQTDLDILQIFGKEELILFLKMIDVARTGKLNFQSEVRLKTTKVKEEINKLKHGLYDRQIIEKAKNLRWLSIDKSGEETIRFTPQELEIKARSVHSWIILSELGEAKSGGSLSDSSGVQVITEDF